MAELLVRVRDKVNPDDPYLNAQCMKRGDVVAACPDGWNWSVAERTNPDWLILSVPGLSVSEAQERFMQTDPLPEPDPNVIRPAVPFRRRKVFLDLDSVKSQIELPPRVRAAAADDGTRSSQLEVVDKAIVLALQQDKDPAPVFKAVERTK